MAMQPLADAPSLGDRAYEAIRDAILELTLRPGQQVAVNQLADLLRVSRTPVRDAMLRLQREGLMTVVPHKGAYVSRISVQDVQDIFELRILLERYAARIAATRMTAEDRARIEETMQQAARAFEQGDPLLAADTAGLIHDMLVRKTNNGRLAACLMDLDSHYGRIRHLAVAIPGRFERSQQEHRAILAALQQADAEAAGMAVVQHLQSVRDDVLANLDTWVDSLEHDREAGVNKRVTQVT